MYFLNKNPLAYDIVSIQSQVIYGTVGNNAAIPNFQRYGLHVCNVPTVLFSNTPHYPTKYGAAIPEEWFAGFLKSLYEREALKSVKAVVLGYLGGAEQANLLADWLRELKSNYPNIHIGIDPVLGDSDSGIYVKSELADCYRQKLIACADVITPNHFELEFLSGEKSTTETEVIASARKLLVGNTKIVVITSSPSENPAEICNLIVTADSVNKTTHQRLDCAVKGTGDTFHATFTSEWIRSNKSTEALTSAVQVAGDFVAKALQDTINENFGELYIAPQQ